MIFAKIIMIFGIIIMLSGLASSMNGVNELQKAHDAEPREYDMGEKNVYNGCTFVESDSSYEYAQGLLFHSFVVVVFGLGIILAGGFIDITSAVKSKSKNTESRSQEQES